MPKTTRLKCPELCINALCRASLISTQTRSVTPSAPLTCVNALCRASLISTRKEWFWSWPSLFVSMPYVGQASFLRGGGTYVKENRWTVSMPYVGQASFLRINYVNVTLQRLGSVNALCRASLISTKTALFTNGNTYSGVNALCRASLISTCQIYFYIRHW